MMTDRDREVIISIGNHRILSTQQLINLHFPSYHTCWRRLRKQLISNRYVSEPFYIDTGTNGARTGLYRLETAGIKLYKELTGKEYVKPRLNNLSLNHKIKLNDILIMLNVKDFELEYRKGNLQIDCLVNKNAIELDLGKEPKNHIIKQFRNYEKTYQLLNFPEKLIFISERAEEIKNLIQDIKLSNIDFIPVFHQKSSIQKLLQRSIL